MEEREEAVRCPCERGTAVTVTYQDGQSELIRCDECQDEIERGDRVDDRGTPTPMGDKNEAEGRLLLTEQYARMIGRIWECEHLGDVMLSVFPSLERYEAMGIPEEMGGTDSDIAIKALIVEEGNSRLRIVFHKPCAANGH